jgi:uncharacterized protein with PhoU and TrkA domain
MDMMLRTDNNLRVEEVIVPEGFAARPLSELGKGRDWQLVAVRRGEGWEFNPDSDALIQGGQALIAIASPAGRRALETMLASLMR